MKCSAVSLPHSFHGATIKGVGGAEGGFADAHGFDDAGLPRRVGGVERVYVESRWTAWSSSRGSFALCCRHMLLLAAWGKMQGIWMSWAFLRQLKMQCIVCEPTIYSQGYNGLIGD